jgi:hypothetical protein
MLEDHVDGAARVGEIGPGEDSLGHRESLV